MQPSDIDILPPEKIAFIAYNVGVFESVQKFGSLITAGKITWDERAPASYYTVTVHTTPDQDIFAQASFKIR